MPDHHQLKIGDRIRLLRVPDGALKQRERELTQGLEDAGWTADTVERIIRQNPIVVIDRIDEYGHPWFNYELIRENGEKEEHTIAISEDDWWMNA